jgi:hypothetical protein
VDINNPVIKLCIEGTRAERVKDGQVKDFSPSLYLSLGH